MKDVVTSLLLLAGTALMLDVLLAARVNRLQNALIFELFVMALGVLVTGYLFAGFYTSVASASQATRTATERVSDGDLSVTLDVEARDEIGEMAQRFNEMLERFKEVIRRYGKENAAVVAKQYLDELRAK